MHALLGVSLLPSGSVGYACIDRLLGFFFVLYIARMGSMALCTRVWHVNAVRCGIPYIGWLSIVYTISNLLLCAGVCTPLLVHREREIMMLPNGCRANDDRFEA